MKLHSATVMFATFGVLLLVGPLSHQSRARGKGKDVTITKDDQTASLECDGNSVTVRSNDNKISVKGKCDKLTVNGEDNTISAMTVKEVSVTGNDNNITVDTAAKINASGNDNNITWKNGAGGKPPEISSKGSDNKIRQLGTK